METHIREPPGCSPMGLQWPWYPADQSATSTLRPGQVRATLPRIRCRWSRDLGESQLSLGYHWGEPLGHLVFKYIYIIYVNII